MKLLKSVILWGILLTVMLTGCGRNGNITTWEYDHPEAVRNLTITKSVYDGEALYIFVKGKDAKKITECECFDSNCEVLDGDWDLKASRNKVVIRGINAAQISGVTLYLGSRDLMYRVRYLDSDQCCILFGEFVCDVGTVYTGDEERFKSDGERDAKRRSKEAREAALTEAFGFLEGYWYSESDSDHHIRAYIDESGARSLEVSGENYYFDGLGASKLYGENIEIILSGDGWNVLYDTLYLDLEEDSVDHEGEIFLRGEDSEEYSKTQKDGGDEDDAGQVDKVDWAALADSKYMEYLKGNIIPEYGDEDELEYALFDMNSDGINELLVRIYEYFIPDIYEYCNDKIYRLTPANGGSAGMSIINTKNQYVGGDTTHVGREVYWISQVDDSANVKTVLLFSKEYEGYDETKEPAFYKMSGSVENYSYDAFETITEEEFEELVEEYTKENDSVLWKDASKMP